MSYFAAILYISLLGIMVYISINMLALAVSVARRTFVQESAVWLWRLLPVTPMLWIVLSVINRGSAIGVDVLFAMAVWGSAWWLARDRMNEDGSAACVLALLFLTSIHLGLMFDLSRSTTSMRGLWISAAPWLAAALGFYCVRRSRGGVYGLLAGDSGALSSVGLIVLACIMALIERSTRHYMPVYAAASLAFLVGVTAIAGRSMQNKSRPRELRSLVTAGSDIGGWLECHWPLLLIVVLTALAPLAIKDFSPVLLIAVTFVLILAASQEKSAACILSILMAVSMGAVYQTGVVPRLEERITIMRSPSAGGNSQLMGDLWSVSRAGFQGGGPGELFTIRTGTKSRRPATILADTDAVFVALAESTGVIGISCTLCAFGVLVHWFLLHASRSESTYTKIWFFGCGALLGLTVLWTSGWVVDIVPMAGLACPLLAAGNGVTLLWSVVTLFSVALAEEEREGIGSTAVDISRVFSQRSIEAVLYVLGTIGLITIISYVSLATWRRDAVLTTPFENREEENKVRDGIETGLFRIGTARVVMVDSSRRLPEAHRFRSAAEESRWASRALRMHEIDVVYSGADRKYRLRPAASNVFQECEPSGLGAVLAAYRGGAR